MAMMWSVSSFVAKLWATKARGFQDTGSNQGSTGAAALAPSVLEVAPGACDTPPAAVQGVGRRRRRRRWATIGTEDPEVLPHPW